MPASAKTLPTSTPRIGSLRYRRADTLEWIVVQPNELLFSTATFLATEWFDGKDWQSTLLADTAEPDDTCLPDHS